MRFYQIGLVPKKYMQPPKKSILKVSNEPNVFHLALEIENVVQMFVCRSLNGSVSFDVAENKRAYLLLVDGNASLGSEHMEKVC